MAEGSLWVYGHTRLSDYYSGALSLREVSNRLAELPAEAGLWSAIKADVEQGKRDELDDALTGLDDRFKPKGG